MPTAPTTGPGDGPSRTRIQVSAPAKALVLLAAIATCAWLIGRRDSHLALAVALVAAVILDAVLGWWALRDLDIEVRPPAQALAGEPTRWNLHVRGWRRPTTVHPLLVRDVEDQLLPGPQPAILTWPAMNRGLMPFIVFDVVARGPLGLVTSGRRVVEHFTEPLAFGPASIEVETRWPRPRPEGFGPVEGAPVGEELFRSIRPYRRGDDRRRVNWKATAHHGQLMVLELDGTGAVVVRIVVELGPDPAGANWTAGLASSVARGALHKGWRVELVTLEGAAVPQLTARGRTFGVAPTVVQPLHVPTATVTARVRNGHDVHRRLAAAASGPVATPSGGVAAGRTCRIDRAGVHWS